MTTILPTALRKVATGLRRRFLVLFLLLLEASALAQGILLNTGDTYQIPLIPGTTLPFVSADGLGLPGAYEAISFRYHLSAMSPDLSWRFEIFPEPFPTSTSIPFHADHGEEPIFGVFVPAYAAAMKWTVLSGAMTLESADVTWTKVVGGNQSFYRNVFTPVPEPGSVVLVTAGLVTFLLYRGTKRRRR